MILQVLPLVVDVDCGPFGPQNNIERLGFSFQSPQQALIPVTVQLDHSPHRYACPLLGTPLGQLFLFQAIFLCLLPFCHSPLTRPSLPYHFHSFIFSLSTCVYRKNLHLQNECGVAAAAAVVFETLELRVLVGFVFDACLFQSKKKLGEGGGGSWGDGVVCQYLHLPFTSSSPNPSQSPLDIGYLFHGNGSSPVHTQKLPLVKRPFPLLSSLSFISFYMCRSYPTPMPSFPLYLYSNSSHQSKIFHAYCLNLTIIHLS